MRRRKIWIPIIEKAARPSLAASAARRSFSQVRYIRSSLSVDDCRVQVLRENWVMKYRTLGRTGLDVCDVAHGLWGMSGWSGSNEQESIESLQLAVDLGCNFFDTAWAYGDGRSDGLLGEIMTRNAGKRLYAASKIPPANDQWPALPKYKYSDVFSAAHVFKYADLIRKQLRVDTIDVLQFHVWDDSWTSVPEFRSTVEKLKHDQWIRYFGLSINRWEPENGIKALRTGLVDVVQVIHNIFDQAPE